MKLNCAVMEIVKLYGGYRATARQTGVTYSYLCRLANGEKTNPSAEVLKKLGITEVKEYALSWEVVEASRGLIV